MPRRRSALVIGALAIAGMTAFFLAAGADEGTLLAQIKNDVFDQKWTAVVTSCDQFIKEFPGSDNLQRAFYYRAQAYEHMKGKEADAIAAYTDYLTRFPGETGALKEDAMLSRITLATSLWLKGDRTHVTWITKGMDDKGYPRLYAAIQASKIDHTPARAKAVPILKDCANLETDAEVKNECVLALLRIDPNATTKLAPPRPPPLPPDPVAATHDAKLIRVEVYDKVKKQVTVRVNMPLAFAELLFQSLGEELQKEITHGLQAKGIALERFWDAFKKGGKQTIVEIDDAKQNIKVWVE
ncbi:MAG TPA: hypothetical protein VGK94_10750 [Candidatus Polarisedimenticolia bacterium]